MEALGMVFLVLVGLLVVLGLIVLAVSLPDIARYRRLRRM